MSCIGPQKNKHITKKMFIDRLRETNGNMYAAYTSLGLPFNRFCKWREEDPEFEAEIQKIKNHTVQWVESKMFELIDKGDQKMTQFFLNCKAGYVSQKNIQAEVKTKDTVDIDLAIKQIEEQIKDKE